MTVESVQRSLMATPVVAGFLTLDSLIREMDQKGQRSLPPVLCTYSRAST